MGAIALIIFTLVLSNIYMPTQAQNALYFNNQAKVYIKSGTTLQVNAHWQQQGRINYF